MFRQRRLNSDSVSASIEHCHETIGSAIGNLSLNDVYSEMSDSKDTRISPKRFKSGNPSLPMNAAQPFVTESTRLFELIRMQFWNDVRIMLNSRSGKQLSYCVDNTGLTLLGAALGSRAPTDIVQTIILYNPNAIHIKDNFGAMPLLVGCLNGISVDVVNMILDLDAGHSARVPDSDNRTALHHAVEYVCRVCLDSDDSTLQSLAYEESLEVMEIILSVAPESLNIQTNSGDFPLDIPQKIKIRRKLTEHSHIDEIIRLLQEKNIELYRMQKAFWENAQYKKLELKSTSLENLHLNSVQTVTTCNDTNSSHGGGKGNSIAMSSI